MPTIEERVTALEKGHVACDCNGLMERLVTASTTEKSLRQDLKNNEEIRTAQVQSIREVISILSGKPWNVLSGSVVDLARTAMTRIATLEASPPSAPPVVEVAEEEASEDCWVVRLGGRHVAHFGDTEAHTAFVNATRAATHLREAITALWPPQVAAGGSWEGAIAWLETRADRASSKWLEPDVDHGTKMYLDGQHNVLREAAAHFRTLSAPGAGGVNRNDQRCTSCGKAMEACVWVCACGDTCTDPRGTAIKQEVHDAAIATRDAEIGRLRAEVKTLKMSLPGQFEAGQDAGRKEVLRDAEAAVAEERAKYGATIADLEARNGRQRAVANDALATIASMRPVVEAAVAYANDYALGEGDDVAALYDLRNAVRAYQARTAGGGGELDAETLATIYGRDATPPSPAGVVPGTTSADVCQRCALIRSGEIVGTCTLHGAPSPAGSDVVRVGEYCGGSGLYVGGKSIIGMDDTKWLESTAVRLREALTPLLADARREGLREAAKLAWNLTEAYQHQPDGRRALDEMQKHLEALAAKGGAA